MCARRSLFIRGLLCTLLVACPALAEPVTGLDDIKLGADRKLQLVVRPEARCVLGDLDAISLEMKRVAQERANPDLVTSTPGRATASAGPGPR